MKNRAQEIRSFLLEKIPDHPKDIVAVTAKKFLVSRTTVHRHLKILIQQGEVLKTGATRQATYYLKSAKNKKLIFEIKPEIGEFEVWKEHLKDSFDELPKNAFDICEYGFGEMFNNALDHSEGKHIGVEIKWEKESVEITIADDGVGIFHKIKQANNLKDDRESALLLSKGKFTTDPDHHTGEGIFFTSRAVDTFSLNSHDHLYMRNNREEDWFLEKGNGFLKGTVVAMIIMLSATKSLQDVFAQYTVHDEDDIPRFDKTHILVELSKLEDERYVSRSQAKRILVGLEKFKHVILDFRNIKTVGQGFVDEVFRVFKIKHPEIKIEYENASDDVKFMIERGLPR